MLLSAINYHFNYSSSDNLLLICKYRKIGEPSLEACQVLSDDLQLSANLTIRGRLTKFRSYLNVRFRSR